jgi:predicted phosphodiesterase
MRVLLVGDIHKNTRFAEYACSVAGDLNISCIIQLGDFGVWPGKSGAEFLHSVDAAAKKFGVDFYFIDGNHEDFDQLDDALKNKERKPDGRVTLRDNVIWLPRGTVLTFDGRRFGFLGGSVSVDKYRRVKFHTWWPQEVIIPENIQQLKKNLDGDHVDVLITHDVPNCVELPFPVSPNWPSDVLQEAKKQRELLNDAVGLSQPKLVVHGHWHATYKTKGSCDDFTFDVVGLCGETGDEPIDGLAVLDTETLKVSFLGETL